MTSHPHSDKTTYLVTRTNIKKPAKFKSDLLRIHGKLHNLFASLKKSRELHSAHSFNNGVEYGGMLPNVLVLGLFSSNLQSHPGRNGSILNLTDYFCDNFYDFV